MSTRTDEEREFLMQEGKVLRKSGKQKGVNVFKVHGIPLENAIVYWKINLDSSRPN